MSDEDVTVRVTPDLGVVIAAKAATIGKASPKAVLRAANYAGGEIARAVYEKLGGGSGRLARSFLPAAFVDVPGQIAAGAFSDLVYAEIQDTGGTIHPKTGKNLAIPVSREAKNKWPRDWGRDVLTLIIAKGKKLLVEKYGKLGKFKLHYVLKPSVTLRGTGYIEAAAAAAELKIQDIIAGGLQDGADA